VKSKGRFTILRDTREQEGTGWQFRASDNCYGVERVKLDVGDYAIKGLEHLIMVERKTLGDLWGTLGPQDSYERFLRELERAAAHKLKYLVIEATLADVDRGYAFSKINSNNIHGKLISLQVKHNLHVIFAGRPDKAREYVRRLFAKLYQYHLDGIL
jgi:ERCC4-type nuclease